MSSHPTGPPMSVRRVLTGIGGVAVSVGSALAYGAAYLNPVGATVGTALGVGVIVYSCVYEKNKAIITWPQPDPVEWRQDLRASEFHTATLNHSETDLTYSKGDEPLEVGRHSLTATAVETANYTAASATRGIEVTKAKQSINWAIPASITYGDTLSGAQLNAILTVGDGQPAYDPGPGAKLPAGPGRALRVDFSETRHYLPASRIVHIEVKKAKQVINWADPAPITYGTLLSAVQLNAVLVTGDGVPAYDKAIGTKLAAGQHIPLSVTFSETANYLATDKVVHIQVEKADQVINWANPNPILQGKALTAFQLNAKLVTGNGNLVYNPVKFAVLPPGHQHPLQVTANETANFKSAIKIVHIDVLSHKAVAIANGHAWPKHGKEFAPVVGNQAQFEVHINRVITDPATVTAALVGNRRKYFHPASGTFVVYNPHDADQGSAYVPPGGLAYYNNFV